VRNPLLGGQRKIISCDTFDIIRHGPALKDKNSADSFSPSPLRNSESVINSAKNLGNYVNIQNRPPPVENLDDLIA
jgi:hypothetical protein